MSETQCPHDADCSCLIERNKFLEAERDKLKNNLQETEHFFDLVCEDRDKLKAELEKYESQTTCARCHCICSCELKQKAEKLAGALRDIQKHQKIVGGTLGELGGTFNIAKAALEEYGEGK